MTIKLMTGVLMHGGIQKPKYIIVVCSLNSNFWASLVNAVWSSREGLCDSDAKRSKIKPPITI